MHVFQFFGAYDNAEFLKYEGSFQNLPELETELQSAVTELLKLITQSKPITGGNMMGKVIQLKDTDFQVIVWDESVKGNAPTLSVLGEKITSRLAAGDPDRAW